jgi:hypothetical protein
MASRHRDKRRGLAQAIYALTVIIVIPAVMLIEVRTSHLMRATRRPPVREFGPDFRPVPHRPNMDLPAQIVVPIDIRPLEH